MPRMINVPLKGARLGSTLGTKVPSSHQVQVEGDNNTFPEKIKVRFIQKACKCSNTYWFQTSLSPIGELARVWRGAVPKLAWYCFCMQFPYSPTQGYFPQTQGIP